MTNTSVPTQLSVWPQSDAVAREKRAKEAYVERLNELSPLPHFKLNDQGSLVFDREDQSEAQMLLMIALGLTRPLEYLTIFEQAVNVTSRNMQVDVHALNGLIALAAGMCPQNSAEAMLAIQTAAIHNATMTQARHLRNSDTFAQMEANSNSLNKLARTFGMQIDAMKRLRSGGPQRVVVEHKHYHLHQTPEAANAAAGGGVETETEHQPHERASIPEREAVLSYIEADEGEMLRAGGEGI